jgi:large subunit ribosomal protein L19
MHATKSVMEIEKKYVRSDIPAFRVGDTVRVHARIIEGEKERIQLYEGVVIAMSGDGSTRTFTVRKISGGIGVETIYPMMSSKIAKLEVVSQGKVRKGRIYYVRGLVGRAAKIKGKDKLKAVAGINIPVTAVEGAKPDADSSSPAN